MSHDRDSNGSQKTPYGKTRNPLEQNTTNTEQKKPRKAADEGVMPAGEEVMPDAESNSSDEEEMSDVPYSDAKASGSNVEQRTINMHFENGTTDEILGKLSEDIVMQTCLHDFSEETTITVEHEGKVHFVTSDETIRLIGEETVQIHQKNGANLTDEGLDRVQPDKVDKNKIRLIIKQIQDLLGAKGFKIIYTFNERTRHFSWYLTHKDASSPRKHIVVAILVWAIKTDSSEYLGSTRRSNYSVERYVICGLVHWVFVYPCARGMELAYLMELLAMCMASLNGVLITNKENDTVNAFAIEITNGKPIDYNVDLKYLPKIPALHPSIIIDLREGSIGSSQGSSQDTDVTGYSGTSSQSSDSSDSLGSLSDLPTSGQCSDISEELNKQNIMAQVRERLSIALRDAFMERITGSERQLFNDALLIAGRQNDPTDEMPFQLAINKITAFVKNAISDEVKSLIINDILENVGGNLCDQKTHEKLIQLITDTLEEYLKDLPTIITSETMTKNGSYLGFEHSGNEAISHFTESLLDNFSSKYGTINKKMLLKAQQISSSPQSVEMVLGGSSITKKRRNKITYKTKKNKQTKRNKGRNKITYKTKKNKQTKRNKGRTKRTKRNKGRTKRRKN
jgi:hypothetical protein